MQYWKSYRKTVTVLLMALAAGAFLAGCRGNLGWERMDGPVGRQSHPGFHQPR